ncbi:MAG TPA: Rid family hydrolase, partial [Jatrophihabitantaceae bacterium]
DPAYLRYNIDSAREFPAASTQLVMSGQIGDPSLDMAGQISGALDAVQTVLEVAGYALADLARITIYTTDVDAFIASYDVIRTRFEPGTVAPHTLVPVTRLARLGCVVEIDAQAAR